MCTGDLTGRYLEMLARSMDHDTHDEERLHQLFNRILKCKTHLGPVGLDFIEGLDNPAKADPFSVGAKTFVGSIRYYLQTGEGKALQLAIDTAEYFLARIEIVDKTITQGKFNTAWWITEPFALLYGITGDERYLKPCRIIEKAMPASIEKTHSHSFMTTLRGLQLAAIFSGDNSFNRLPEKFRTEIQERAVWADGNIPEIFPMSTRNEGCSIADWIMLNLYAGFITGNDEAYEKAELAMYNAFALNQLVNGSFGHRLLDKDRRGYQQGELVEEAWWCCVHNCGISIIEYANHAVTLRDNYIKVNLLVPGKYCFEIDGKKVTVTITARYPEKADALIFLTGACQGLELDVRIPAGIRNGKVSKTVMPGGGLRFTLSGDIGYYIETTPHGSVLKYGPLVMVPLRYMSKSEVVYDDFSKSAAPEGYVPDIMPTDRPVIVPVKEKDDAGFFVYSQEPWPVWQCYEEGILSPLAYGELSVNVPLYYPDGQIRLTRFYPEWLSSTSLVGFDLPLVF
ncbi:MAG: glycoside hydrolase family 127 protein [Clostridiaceae bacterium]|nr:glycoside hydrolase family 127 protein [Clostridiaceae bacterium]